jgi:TPR repeat protein
LDLAWKLLLKAAEQGEPEAFAELADWIGIGFNGEPNPPEAERLQAKAQELMESAAAVSNLRALHWLAEWHLGGDRDASSLEEAQRLLIRATELGDARAMVSLAELYASGLFGPDRRDEAVAWCIKAYEMKEPSAFLLLADLHEQGIGAAPDLPRALRRQAAERGDVRGMRLYAQMLMNGAGGNADIAEALQWYESAAGFGDGPSLTQIGICFKEGRGYQRNDSLAVAYFRRGASQGDAESVFQMGVFLKAGVGVRQDLTGAARLFQNAAGMGHGEAMYQLAELFRTGQGVTMDATTAFIWYQHAALKGHIGAAENLGEMFAAGIGVEKDDYLSAIWLARAETWSAKQAAAHHGLNDPSLVSRADVVSEIGSLVDPVGDVEILTNKTSLTVLLPPGNRDLTKFPAMAPRIVHEIQGDIVIEATAFGEMTIISNRSENEDSKRPWISAGLLLWESDSNFVYCGRAWMAIDGNMQHVCRMQIVVKGKVMVTIDRQIPNQTTRFRLERRGDRVRAGFSQDDGTSWTLFRSQESQFANRLQAGVTALQSSSQRLSVQFDSVTVQK